MADRNVHDHCGVRTRKDVEYIDITDGVPCPQVARYSGTFTDPYYGGKTTIGLCEHHATQSFIPVIERSKYINGVPAALVSMHSMDREVYERNLLRSSFTELVSA